MAENSIIVRQGQAQRVELEKIPAAAFYPGHLVELTSADRVQKHSTAGGNITPALFAIEDENQGKDIDDAFGTSGRAVCWIPQAGDWVLGVLADGETVVIGDKLESGGDGTLKKHVSDTADSDDPVTVYPNQIVGIAMEALDLSDSSGGESVNTFDGGYDQRLWLMIV